MRALIQRVKHARVTINGEESRKINAGMLVLLGIESADTISDQDWLIKKLIGLRIFPDEKDKMNLSIKEIEGDFMVISQFTLHASTKKGNRPSWIKAALPEFAEPMYKSFVRKLSEEAGLKVITGEFGAHMDIELINDGPVTIMIDSKTKE